MPPSDTPREKSPRADRVDEVLALLADARRRRVLYELRDRSDDVATLDELVDALLPEEDGAADDPAHERVAASLCHHHLPKLADAGVVQYDERSGVVRYEKDDDLLESWLERLAALER